MTRKKSHSPKVQAILEEVEQLKFQGEYKEALILLEELLIEDPGNITALEEIADNELSLEHYDRAKHAAMQAIALDPQSSQGHYALGFLHSQEEKWDKAKEHLKQANIIQPNNPEIIRCLGWALFHSDHRLQGIVTLERSLNLEHDNTLTLCDLGVIYLEARNFSKAKALFRRVIDINPDDERAKECIDLVHRLEKKSRGKRSHSSKS